MKTILFAHPDDEIIYFLPFVKEGGNRFICLTDGNYRGRGKERKDACYKLLTKYKNEVYFLDLKDDPEEVHFTLYMQDRIMGLLKGTVYTHSPVDFKGEHSQHLLCAAYIACLTNDSYYWCNGFGGSLENTRSIETKEIADTLLEYYPKETQDYLLYNYYQYTQMDGLSALELLNACDRMRVVFSGTWKFFDSVYELQRFEESWSYLSRVMYDNYPTYSCELLEVGPGVEKFMEKKLNSFYPWCSYKSCGIEKSATWKSVREIPSGSKFDVVVLFESLYYLTWQERVYINSFEAKYVVLSVPERDVHLVWDAFGEKYSAIEEEDYLGTVF
jgi:hypothetical protein